MILNRTIHLWPCYFNLILFISINYSISIWVPSFRTVIGTLADFNLLLPRWEVTIHEEQCVVFSVKINASNYINLYFWWEVTAHEERVVWGNFISIIEMLYLCMFSTFHCFNISSLNLSTRLPLPQSWVMICCNKVRMYSRS